MKTCITTLALIFYVVPLSADYDENRLLEEWGLQLNGQQRLELNDQSAPGPADPSWQPEVTGFDNRHEAADQAIDPIVIRSN